jgi:hypothetical protein
MLNIELSLSFLNFEDASVGFSCNSIVFISESCYLNCFGTGLLDVFWFYGSCFLSSCCSFFLELELGKSFCLSIDVNFVISESILLCALTGSSFYCLLAILKISDFFFFGLDTSPS